MDANRRQLVIAAVLLLGLPGTIFLWGKVFDRYSNPASAHIAAAERAMKSGRYVEAMTAIAHAAEVRPNDATVQRLMMKARTFLAAEQPARITADSVESLRYEAAYLLGEDRRNAVVYLTTLGNIAARTGDAAEARSRFSEAVKRDPNSAVAHIGLGLFLMGQKDGAAPATQEFEAVLKANPDNLIALVGLAQVDLNTNKVAQAEERLEKALKVGDDFTARMMLGQAKIKLNKAAEAVPHFQRATELLPNNANGFRSLGEALLASGKLPEAERSLRVSAQLQQDPGTILALGFALERQKKSDQALGLFNSILQQNSDAAPALLGAGSALEDLGKKADALAYYRKLVSLPEGQGPEQQLLVQLKQQAQSRMQTIEGKAPPAATPQPGAAAPKGMAPQ
jgi:tetratricopeptide (TPR) repeat protein